MPPDPGCRALETELTAFAQGELSPARRAEIEAHLGGCAACARTLEEIRSIFAAAASIEDLAPSLRFRRDVERLVRRARDSAPASGGLLWRLATAAAFLAHRFRTSRRFQLAAVSAAVHVAILLGLSLVVLPRMEESPREPSVVYEPEVVRARGRGVRSPAAGAPEPAEVEAPSPYVVEEAPSPVPPRPRLLFPRTAPILPPAEKVLYRRPTGIFAQLLDPEVRFERLASLAEEPEAVVSSVDRALRWLARAQHEDGSWAASRDYGAYRIGVTSTALIAFLADGHGLTRGSKDYRRVVRRALDRLLAEQATEGPLAGLIGPAEGHYTYNHALATLALVEVYCLEYRRVPTGLAERLKGSIRAAIGLIERSQSPAGGWRYEYRSGPPYANDTSVSLFQVMALAAARTARFAVKEKVLSAFSRWLRSVTDERGVVSYQERGTWTKKPRTLTAGALFLEEQLGLSRPVRARQAREVLAEIRDPHGSAPRNGLLRFYAAHAFGLRGDPVLASFLPALVRSQEPDGSWRSGGDEYARYGGDAFLTALNVLTITAAY